MLSVVKASLGVLGVVGASLLPPLAAQRAHPQPSATSSSALSQCLLPAGHDAEATESCAAMMIRADFAIPHQNVSIDAIFGHDFR